MNQELLIALVNHLWQSTAVVGVAWLLALALRKNHARVRYWVWMAASAKFLLPFSLLMTAGEWLRSWIPVQAARPAVADVVEQVTQPFAGTQFFDATLTQAATPHVDWLMLVLMVWACGAMVVFSRFAWGWWRVYSAKRTARPLGVICGGLFIEADHPSGAKAPYSFFSTHGPAKAVPLLQDLLRLSFSALCKLVPFQNGDSFRPYFEVAADVPALSSRTLIEPGIFGIFRPVLLLPEGILERLTEDQMYTIVAHEMAHVRRRDNLTFAFHMVVEALFWFYLPVWWIGMRLIEERERACDEAVVAVGGAAHVYAEGILNVCKFYVEAPVACVAGVTGADLKKRIARIMTQQMGRKLSTGRKLLMCAAGLLALTVPLTLGLMHAGQVSAQEKSKEPVLNLPQFDVVSIKPIKVNVDRKMDVIFTPDGVNITGIPLHMLMYEVFGLPDDRILNLPDWVRSSRYDIEAKVDPADAPKLKDLTLEQRWAMMVPVLRDRFGLKLHDTSRVLEVYSLETAKGGPKLVEAKAPNRNDRLMAQRAMMMRFTAQGLNLEGHGDSMSSLAHTISLQLGSTVVDKTGLTGAYDYTLTWIPDRSNGPLMPIAGGEPASAESGPSLFAALQEQLGLKLVPQKQPVEVLVIDHVEPPSAN